MQDVSKEWLDFRRNQFPAGSRIQTWELDDPRNTLKEARKLDYIDDSGRFHVRQSDGGECVLTLGEEMFSVHPPESTQLKLYMPLTASPQSQCGRSTSQSGYRSSPWWAITSPTS